jgi:hypothetical protein
MAACIEARVEFACLVTAQQSACNAPSETSSAQRVSLLLDFDVRERQST